MLSYSLFDFLCELDDVRLVVEVVVFEVHLDSIVADLFAVQIHFYFS
jgi:hypothetical protein